MRGIYTATSGLVSSLERVNVINNNIANAQTAGFKRDQITFREHVVPFEVILKNAHHIPRKNGAPEGVLPEARRLVEVHSTYVDWTPGPIQVTNNPLNVAIEGQGFFVVQTPRGIRLTRQGQFHLDGQGRLVNSSGFPVIGSNGNVIRVLPSGGPIRISQNGLVLQGNQPLGQLQVVTVADVKALRKEGASLFYVPENVQVQTLLTPQLLPGAIEASNVNLAKEMVDLISSTRHFEANQRVVQSFDQLTHRLVTEIPKF